MNLRYERKYVAPGLSHQQVLLLLRRHPALLRVAFPPRRVNSVYLDTPGLADYFDHVNGSPSRSKTRIRWYGNAGIEAPVLEHKVKIGAVGHKVTWRLAPIEAGWLDRGAPLRGVAADDQQRAAMARRAPVLVTRYERSYLASAIGPLRITVDHDLVFSRVGSAAPPVPAPAELAVVVELKYGQEASDFAAEVAAALPLRMVRCSKYVLGVERV